MQINRNVVVYLEKNHNTGLQLTRNVLLDAGVRVGRERKRSKPTCRFSADRQAFQPDFFLSHIDVPRV